MTPAFPALTRSAAAAALLLLISACAGPQLVEADGQFADCAGSDCVSSQASDPAHFIKPLRYGGVSHAARGRLVELLEAMDGGEIVTNSQCYLHARIDGALRRRQDIEFWLCNRPALIDVRAARPGGLFGGDSSRELVEYLRRSMLPDPERPLQR